MNRKQLIKSIKEELDDLEKDVVDNYQQYATDHYFDYTGAGKKLDELVTQMSRFLDGVQEALQPIAESPDDDIAELAKSLLSRSQTDLASSIMMCATMGKGDFARLIDEMLNG